MNPLHFAIAFVLFCSVTNTIRADPCDQNTMMSCLGGVDLQALSTGFDPSTMDLSKICGMVSCFADLQCEFPSEQQSMVAMTDALKPYCPASGGDGSECSFTTFQACAGDLMKTDNPTPEDMKKACPTQKCLAGLLPTCQGDLKKTVEMMVSKLAQVCVEGCEMSKVMACQQKMKDMEDPDDITKEYCETMKETAECIDPFLSTCTGEMATSLETISSGAKCCDKIVKVKEDCIPENADQLFKDNDFDSCKKKEDAFSCMMISKLECPGSAKSIIDSMKQEGKQAVEDCEKQGYNLTISVESGKPLNDPGMGVAIQPSATILFALVLAIVSWWF